MRCVTATPVRTVSWCPIMAVVSLIAIEFVMFAFLSTTGKAALVLAVAVLLVCAAIYLYARKSTIVRFANEPDRSAATWPHRVFGMLFGMGTAIVAFIIVRTTAL